MKMIESEDLLEKLMNDEITREEFEVFLEGLDDTEIQAKYVKYLQLKFEEHLETHHTSLEEKPDFFTDHPLLHARKPEKQHVPVKTRKRFRPSIAAALLMLVGLAFSTLFFISQFDGNNKALEANKDVGPQILTKTTPNKRMFRMRLQDGSFVHLNAVSSISYPRKFDEKSREIEILGEAYFSVERDEKRPFNIKVKDHTVRVLGTSFSIKSYDEEDFSVTVESGTVSVELNQDDLTPVVLTKGEKLVFNPETEDIQVLTVNSEDELSWRKGILRFDATPMTEVEKILERWYGIDLIIEDRDIYKKTLSGIHQNENLKSVIESLTFATGTKYLIKDNSIIIKN